jgi:hypothetical protein
VWSEYLEIRNQAFNIGCWQAGGELQMQTPEDDRSTKMREYEEVKARGKDFYLDLLEKGKRIREEANKL